MGQRNLLLLALLAVLVVTTFAKVKIRNGSFKHKEFKNKVAQKLIAKKDNEIEAYVTEMLASANSRVGSVEGSFSVNDASGSATYAIPIQLAPGTNKAVPPLSLAYSSGRKSNHMGQGWFIKGVGSITRCSPTVAQDGFFNSVSYTNNDRFCISGKRLVAINGGEYGADGTEYKLEIDAMAKLVSHGVMPDGGPEWFELWTKDGKYEQFGYSKNSQIMANGKQAVRIWAATSIIDSVGNYFNYTYTNQSNGEYVVSRIHYTGHAMALNPYNYVEFNYITRKDIHEVWIGGSYVQTKYLLSSVVTVVEGTPQFNYSITYEQNAGNEISRITSIQQCSNSLSGVLCIPATYFVWSEENNKPFEKQQLNSVQLPLGSGSSLQKLNLARMKIGDFDGNGFNDILIVTNGPTFGTGQPSKFYMNKGNNQFATVNGPVFAVPAAVQTAQLYIDALKVVDWNKDGKSDIYMVTSSGTSATTDKIYISTSSAPFTVSFSTVNGPATVFRLTGPQGGTDSRRHRFGDFNGDGLTDVYYINGNGNAAPDSIWITHYNTQNKQFTYSHVAGVSTYVSSVNAQAGNDLTRINLVDMNADHRTDVYYINGTNAKVADTIYLTQINAASFKVIHGPATFIGGSTQQIGLDLSRFKFGDFNADGLTDVYYINGLNSQAIDDMYLFDGATSFARRNGLNTFISNSAQLDISRYNVKDFNSDSYADIYFTNGLSSTPTMDSLYLSTGSGTFNKINGAVTKVDASVPVATLDLKKIMQADFNGDGMLDVLVVNGTNFISFNMNVAPRLTAIQTGLGKNSSISYEPITNTAIYKKGTDAVFPVMDVIGSLFVVSSVKVSNGLGGADEYRYTYEHGQQHLQGYGFLGFATSVANHVTTKTSTTYVYSQDYANQIQFQQLVQTKYAIDDSNVSKMIKKVTFSYYSSKNTTGSSGAIYTVNMKSKVRVSNDLNGAPIGTSTESYTYDEYSNPILVQSVSTDSTGKYVQNVTKTFKNIISGKKWIIGLTTKEVTTKQALNMPMLTKITEYTYDSNGLVLSQVQFPNTQYTISYSYSYDIFGNRLTVSVSGADIMTRIHQSTFDSKGRFQASNTNALNHRTTYTYDPAFGAVLSSVDPNGLKNEVSYNTFGLRLNQKFVDGSSSSANYLFCKWIHPTTRLVPKCPENAIYVILTQSTSSSYSIKYYDVLQREIRSGERTQNSTIWNFKDTAFGVSGKIQAVTNPYAADITHDNKPLEQVYRTTYTYDQLGRQTEISYPTGAKEQTVYNGLHVIKIDANSNTFNEYSNSLGHILSKSDPNGGQVTITYDSFGNELSIGDSKGNKMTAEYDILGHKTKVVDPDMGTMLFKHDVLGHVLQKIDANNNVITFKYDLLGRILQRNSSLDGVTNYSYDEGKHATGKLTSTSNSLTGSVAFKESYTYDSFSQVARKLTQIGSRTYNTTSSYQTGRVVQTTFPSLLSFSNLYTTTNQLQSISGNLGNVLYTVDAYDARGNIIKETFGNGVQTTRSYDSMNRLITQTTSDPNGKVLENITLSYDGNNNLLSRFNSVNKREETFAYDKVNRLIKAQDTETGKTLTYQYDVLGNMIQNSRFGTYSYGCSTDDCKHAGPHAVTSISSNGKVHKIIYDNSGNMISGLNRTLSYTAAGLTQSILMDSGDYSHFYYSPDNHRYLQVSKTFNKTYVGFFDETTYPNGQKEQHHRIGDKATIILRGTSPSIFFMHTDHLGSVRMITDTNGTVVQEFDYTPFGVQTVRHNAVGEEVTSAGYTAQEELANVGLVHMNGRIYDPVLARFLSADPTIQDPTNLQNLNRYSYVNNRPLVSSDPSGYHHHHHHHGFFWHLFHAIFKAIEDVVLAVAAFYCPECVAGFEAAKAIVEAKVEGESWGMALISGAAAFATWEVALEDPEVLSVGAKIGIDGAIGGANSEIHGHSFVSGFISGATIAFKNNDLLATGEGYVKTGIQKSMEKQVEKAVNAQLAAHLGFAIKLKKLGVNVIATVKAIESGDDEKLAKLTVKHVAHFIAFDVLEVQHTNAYKDVTKVVHVLHQISKANSKISSLETKLQGELRGPTMLISFPRSLPGGRVGVNFYVSTNPHVCQFTLGFKAPLNFGSMLVGSSLANLVGYDTTEADLTTGGRHNIAVTDKKNDVPQQFWG